MFEKPDRGPVEACEMHIVGHKIFVRMKDIPMYLSKKTRDSIRNRYSHSVEVGLSTEYTLASLSRDLGLDLNFFGVAKIVGLVHDIGHTAFSHDGEVILDTLLLEASKDLKNPVRFDANLNNFRRIEKYRLFASLPNDIKRYTLASLIKREKDLEKYPEYRYLREYLKEAMELEERYLSTKGIAIQNKTGKTILCQAMDLADENRYRVTDIIDSLNIYSKEKLRKILTDSIISTVRLKEISKLVFIDTSAYAHLHNGHIDKLPVKDLLIMLLQQESNAKTDFQNLMNTLSMAFNRNVTLDKDGKLTPHHEEIEKLRADFQKIGAKYIWGSKRVKNIKQPFKHYFATVARYFIFEPYNYDFIDSTTYKNELQKLAKANRREEELKVIRNFLGGLTNSKIMELYRAIKVEAFEREHHSPIAKKEKLIYKISMKEFEKKIEKYRQKANA